MCAHALLSLLGETKVVRSTEAESKMVGGAEGKRSYCLGFISLFSGEAALGRQMGAGGSWFSPHCVGLRERTQVTGFIARALPH